MGPVIQKNMNRCIHCTRCIRFGAEIAGAREMVALQRGNRTEISTIDGRPLETDYAGNYADVCPTGSLTLKDFRFHKRAWMLKKTASTCEACSRGCSIELQHERDVIYRTIPRFNASVNKHWMCDEGRFHYHLVHDEGRVLEPLVQNRSKLESADWKRALEKAKDVLSEGVSTVLIGSDLTLEEASSILQFVKLNYSKAEVFHFGTPGILSSKDDKDEDKILRRLSKTSNLLGLEKLGIKGTDKVSNGTKAVLVFRGGRAVLPALGKHPVVGVGVFTQTEAAEFSAVLPGLTFAEKDGTIVNSAGLEQKLVRAIAPQGDSKPVSEILMLWTHGSSSKAGAA
jgi:NADH-quinone oxidoreductase subunit G